MGNFLDEFEELQVYTNEEAKPDPNWTWFYRIICDENEYINGGEVNLCKCDECEEFGKDIFEYFSIYTALTWVKRNHPDAMVYLWVSSKEFLHDNSENLFRLYSEYYSCAFLKTLGKDLARLLSTLGVEVLEYCYANKVIIPVFF